MTLDTSKVLLFRFTSKLATPPFKPLNWSNSIFEDILLTKWLKYFLGYMIFPMIPRCVSTKKFLPKRSLKVLGFFTPIFFSYISLIFQELTVSGPSCWNKRTSSCTIIDVYCVVWNKIDAIISENIQWNEYKNILLKH